MRHSTKQQRNVASLQSPAKPSLHPALLSREAIQGDLQDHTLISIRPTTAQNGRRWNCERFGVCTSGIVIIVLTILGHCHSHLWHLLLLIIGLNMVVSALADRCAYRGFLRACGVPLAWEQGWSDGRRTAEFERTGAQVVNGGTAKISNTSPVED